MPELILSDNEMTKGYVRIPLMHSTDNGKDASRPCSTESHRSIENNNQAYQGYLIDKERTLPARHRRFSGNHVSLLKKIAMAIVAFILAVTLVSLYMQSKRGRHTRVAVATTLYSDSYLEGALVLGHSIEEHSSRSLEKVVLYIPGRLKNSTLCSLESNGWIVIPVDRIAPPNSLEGKVWSQFLDQFTKLRLWQLEQYDNILYIDSDCLARGDISVVFDLPNFIDFAAVPDVWAGQEHKAQFNAGVLYIKPNQTLFETFLSAIGTTQYNFGMAEQGFLNEFYKYTAVRLPYTWNANLATKHWPEEWKKLFDTAKIVHYTIEKPMVDGRETDNYKYENLFWHAQNAKMRTPEHDAQRKECAKRDVVVER